MAKKRSTKGSQEQQPQYRYDVPIESSEELSSKSRYKLKLAYIIDPEEIAMLIAASMEPYVDLTVVNTPDVDYTTYSEEEIQSLVSGQYKRKVRKARCAVPETK
jgi:hypothetical protein